MKKITIGRGNDCGITIADTTDIVSRHHAVITFTFWGKMHIYDTSSNGTFVNNERLKKGEARLITKKDSVNFGHVWDLDWTMVKDPYAKIRLLAILGVLALFVMIGLASCYFVTKKNVPKELPTVPVIQNDSTALPVRENAMESTSLDNSAKNNVTQRKSRNKKTSAKAKSHAVDSVAEYKGNKKDAEDSKPRNGKNVSPIIY